MTDLPLQTPPAADGWDRGPLLIASAAGPLDRARSTAAALFDLTKPRLAAMSVASAMVAYATAGKNPAPAQTVAATIGIALSAGGALSLNQWWERRTDARMRRTQTRPLPQRRVPPRVALGWSLLLSAAGVSLLAGTIDVVPAGLAAATILIYGVVYTPLKRRTRWATEIGAVSGALPALLGNAAAGDLSARPGLALTAILLFWQMPHFYAIGWRHRIDYRSAGFPLLPASDPTGARTAAWSLGYTCALVVASLIPCALGWFGPSYGLATAAAGAWLLRSAWRFRAGNNRDQAARGLFFVSICYLPLVMAALVVERFLSAWR